MLRQARARWLAAATLAAVVACSAGFAALRNARQPVPAAAPAPPATAPLSPGRAAFERLNCMNCHSVAGRGNPATPLDGVAERLDASALRDWTLGQGTAAAQLSATTRRRKAAAAEDPELPALLEYLSSLR